MAKRIVYFVRGGTKNGAYLTIRTRGLTARKYSWTNYKNRLVEMTYDQARNAARQTYGGRVCKRVYDGREIVQETTVW